jgi:hypothetical protein
MNIAAKRFDAVRARAEKRRRQSEKCSCPTPRTTVEAILWCVRERGVEALREPANIERLLRCDSAARAEINERIAHGIAARDIAA